MPVRVIKDQADTPSVIRKMRRKSRINSWSRRRFRFNIRTATIADLPDLVSAEKKAWEETKAAVFGEKELLAQLVKYPKGTIGAERVLEKGLRRIEAFFSLMRISSSMLEYIVEKPSSWEEITSGGYIENHDPDGEFFYGINLSVPPRLERLGIGNRLRGMIAFTVISEGCKGIVFESRLPKLKTHNDVREMQNLPRLDGISYVNLRDSKGRIWDPEVRNYLSTPFMTVLAVKPNFFEDEESENWGVLMFWPNPLYKFHLGFLYRLKPVTNPIIGIVARLVRSIV